MKVTFVSKHRPGFTHEEWYPSQDFLRQNPSLSTIISAANLQSEETLGVVSKSAETSLTDKSKKWRENQFVEYPVWISRGKGEGQIRRVVSNSHNTLTIDRKWTTQPDESSQYVVTYNIIEKNIAQTRGNTFPS